MIPTDRPPTARQYGESRKAYAAFRVWLRVRSIRRAADEVGKSRQLLERWSVKWGWVGRRKAADLERRRRGRDVGWMETAEPPQVQAPPLDELDRLLAMMVKRRA